MEAHVFTSTLEFQAQRYEKTRTLASVRAKKLYKLLLFETAAAHIRLRSREVYLKLTA